LAIDLTQNNVAQQILQWVETKQYKVNILINNAGFGLAGRFEAYPYAKTADMMQINMQTLTELCYVFLPMLKAQSKSYILNIASSTAYQAIPNMSVYAATKVYVLYFSRGLKMELKDTSVSVTVISPGATDTNFNDVAQIGEKAREQAKKVTMSPQEVAQISIESMFAEKTEVVPGFINKLGKLLVWLAPKSLTEKVAKGIYE
jgi:short-subunit dehydrogenase